MWSHVVTYAPMATTDLTSAAEAGDPVPARATGALSLFAAAVPVRKRPRDERTAGSDGVRRSGFARLVHVVRTTRDVIAETLRNAWRDRIFGLSAETAFWELLSLPPLLIALLGVLGYASTKLPIGTSVRIQSNALDIAREVLAPSVVDQIIDPVVSAILEGGRGEVIGLGTLLALWAGSSATATFVNTITIAYRQRDLRSALRSRLLALWLYVLAVISGTILLPALVLGPGELDSLLPESWHDAGLNVIRWGYWPVVGLLVFGAISVLYHVATPIRLHWRRAFPGAAVALALFLLLSYGLRAYIGAIAGRLHVYATLSAPILALLYFYVLAFAILLGAEFNATLEARWPRGTRRRPLEVIRDVMRARRERASAAAELDGATAAATDPEAHATPVGDEPVGDEPVGNESVGNEPVGPRAVGAEQVGIEPAGPGPEAGSDRPRQASDQRLRDS